MTMIVVINKYTKNIQCDKCVEMYVVNKILDVLGCLDRWIDGIGYYKDRL